MQGEGKEIARTSLGGLSDLAWGISPDGFHIAIQSGDQLPKQVRIIDLRNKTERNLHLPHGWSLFWALHWTGDSNALLVTLSQSTNYLIARIEMDGKTLVLLDRGRNQWLSSPVPSPDGRHLAFSQQTFETNAWLLENF